MELEKILIQRIVLKFYKEHLPSERELAKEFKVSRQKIREVLLTLQHQGWIQIQHGKYSTINQYLEKGGLEILSSLVKYQILELPEIDHKRFLVSLLEIRYALAPIYAKDALEHNANKIIQFLENALKNIEEIKHSSKEITEFDWNFHRTLCLHARNKLFLFLLNSFYDIYLTYGNIYFSLESARERSLLFYNQFYKHVKKNHWSRAVLEIKKVTKESISILQTALR